MIQHSSDETLLIIGGCFPIFKIINGAGIGIGPAIKQLFDVGSNRAKFTLITASNDNELVVIKN